MVLRVCILLSIVTSVFASEAQIPTIGACCPSQTNIDPPPSRFGTGPAGGKGGSATSAQSIAPLNSVDPGALVDADWHIKLQDQGVNVAASYYIELVGNPVGGAAKGFANAASLGVALGLDFDKIANIYGLSFFSSAVFRSGVNLSARKIDNQFNVAQLYGGETVRLNEIYLKETLFNGNFHIKAGHLTAGNDFLCSPFYCEFISLAICGNPISILFNAPFLDYPFSTWGAYLDFKPIQPLLFKFAVYNDNLSLKENKYHGVNFTFKSTAGVMWMTEWVYMLNQGIGDTGYKGNYKFGGYFQTGKINLFKGGSQTGNYGLYFLFDQMLYRKYGPGTTQGLTAFGAFLFAPPNRNLFPYFFDFGLIYKGLFFDRNRDYLSLGIARGNYSADLRSVEKESKESGIPSIYGDKPQTAETILELNYWFRFNRQFALTPGFQYIINPKGYGTTPNAFVLELQISIDLIGVPSQP